MPVPMRESDDLNPALIALIEPARVFDVGFRVQGIGSQIEGVGSTVYGLGLRV